MVLRFGGSLPRACATVAALALASTTSSGHTVHRSDEQANAAPEVFNEPVAFAGTNAETAWMVTAIIFIVLFALSIIVCIYLWYLRNAKMKELRYIQNVHAGTSKDHRNVWYGGGAHM